MFEDLWQYHGVDWIAMVITCFAIWKIGDKKRSGFIIMIISNFCWLVLAVLTASLAMFIANIIFILINLRALVKWSKES